jgi:glyoxylase-like metal-dependent hydrolase (beta-lactamase superfamily II)
MRAIGVHEDVVVVTSRIWQTTSTAVRGGGEVFVIDSPVLPDELELLPALLEQARFEVHGLLTTHADWDHLLGRLAFADAALGCAETTAARLAAEPGAPQRELRAWDDEHYVERPRPLSLGKLQTLPVPGYCAVGDRELELVSADGHTADGMAIWAPWARVLVCGDYLSPVELPMLSPGGGLDAYQATLERLRPLAEQAVAVVPGHGGVMDAPRALELLGEDQAYLDALAREGESAPLPAGRASAAQRRIHADNAARLA